MKGFLASCDCGYTRTSKTQALADKGLAMHSCQRQAERLAMSARVQARKADTGTLRDCQCKEAQHVHGTRLAYVIDKCSCRPCRDANSAVRRQESKLKAYGRYETNRVPIGPIQNHIQYLQDNGISVKQLAKLSGVSLSTLGAIKWGRTERNNQQYTRVLKTTAAKILAVKPSLDQMAVGRVIGSTGTRRRLEALVYLGYSQQELGHRLNISPSNMTAFMRRDHVTAGGARKVTALYERLWNRPAIAEDHRTKISVNRARNNARRNGYAPPLAWDDDTIDDPTATPAGATKPRSIQEQRIEDLEHLLDTGTGYHELLQRLGVTRSTLDQTIVRAGRRDLATRLTHLADARRSAAA